MATVLASTSASRQGASVSEYLDREWTAESAGGRKSEYVGGEIREMPGAGWRHNAIVANLIVAIGMRLRGKPFAACGSEMRVRVAASGPFYYPDVSVSPVPPSIARDRGETLLNPVVIIEVLSPSTEAIDPGEKLANYALISGFSDYVIVDPNSIRIDLYSRIENDAWRLDLLRESETKLRLRSLAIELPLSEIYDRVLIGEGTS